MDNTAAHGLAQSKDPNSTHTTISVCLGLLLLFAAGCASTQTHTTINPSPSSHAPQTPQTSAQPALTSTRTEIGTACYYSRRYHGKRTASGEIYNMNELTAAHRRLPFGATVRVTNLRNNRSVIVRINDRGPFRRGRIIDLSLAAARQLDMVKSGLARVQIEPANPRPERSVATAP